MMQDKDMLEKALEAIAQLPPEQREAAMADLFRDYPGLQQQIDNDMALGQELALQEAPGMTHGPKDNPYAVSIAASPLEHAVRGFEKYKGGKMMGEARESAADLSAAQERALRGTAGSMLPQGPQAPSTWLTPEEEEEERRRRMRGAYA